MSLDIKSFSQRIMPVLRSPVVNFFGVVHEKNPRALLSSAAPFQPMKKTRLRYNLAGSNSIVVILISSLQIWLATPLSSIAIEASPGQPVPAQGQAPSPPIVHVN